MFLLEISMAFIAGVSVVGQWFTTMRGFAIGVTLAGMGIGQLVLCIVIEKLLVFGWRQTLRYLSVIMLCGLSLSSLGISRRVPVDPSIKVIDWQKAISSTMQSIDKLCCHASGRNTSAATMKTKSSYGTEASLVHYFRTDQNFRYLYMGVLMLSLGGSIPTAHLVNYAIVHGISPSSAALLLSMMGIGNAIGRAGLGLMADVFGRIIIFKVCAFLCGAATISWLGCFSYDLLLLYALVYGICYGGFFSILPSVAVDLFGVKNLATILGLIYTSCCLGDLTSAPIGGFIYAATGNYVGSIVVSGGFMLLASVLVTLGLNRTSSVDLKQSALDMDEQHLSLKLHRHDNNLHNADEEGHIQPDPDRNQGVGEFKSTQWSVNVPRVLSRQPSFGSETSVHGVRSNSSSSIPRFRSTSSNALSGQDESTGFQMSDGAFNVDSTSVNVVNQSPASPASPVSLPGTALTTSVGSSKLSSKKFTYSPSVSNSPRDANLAVNELLRSQDETDKNYIFSNSSTSDRSRSSSKARSPSSPPTASSQPQDSSSISNLSSMFPTTYTLSGLNVFNSLNSPSTRSNNHNQSTAIADGESFKYGSFEDGGSYKFGIVMR